MVAQAWLWGPLTLDTFAALLPICGGGDAKDIRGLLGSGDGGVDFGSMEDRVKALAKLPIWAFHGKKDSVVMVKRSQEMVKLVQEAGGNVKYTEYPELNHNSWDETYGDAEVIAWLLAQRRP